MPDQAATAHPTARIITSVAPVAAVQRRTLRLLFTTQVVGGIGMAIGFSVGALLAADMAGVAVSGLAQSAAVVGAALLAIPATRIVERHGRRPSLASVYLIAALGGMIIVAAAVVGSLPLLFAGFFLFGGGTTAGLQARYAAVDLAPADLRGRHLSLIVWATTLGAVAGPNLAPVAGVALQRYGVPTLAAPFFFSAVLLALAAAILLAWMRPDPMVLARAMNREQTEAAPPRAGTPGDAMRGPTAVGNATAVRSVGMGAALAAVVSEPAARLGMAATAVGHLVMVGVMAMTPVHVLGAGHGAAHTLRIVGVLLSLHVAGMFAFAPVTGWLTDRYGRRPVILGGSALLVLACAVAGTAGHDSARLAIGLTLLGLGWSATMVAGSTLLTDAVPSALRPSAQGLSDLTMGLAAASAAAVAGLVLQEWGFPVLTLAGALAAAPLMVLALRRSADPIADGRVSALR